MVVLRLRNLYAEATAGLAECALKGARATVQYGDARAARWETAQGSRGLEPSRGGSVPGDVGLVARQVLF